MVSATTFLLARAAAPVGWSGWLVVAATAAVVTAAIVVDVRRSRAAAALGVLSALGLGLVVAWRFMEFG
jgi:hypothetical protein